MTGRFELNVVDAVDPIQWDSALTLLGGNIFHSSIWAQYIRSQNHNIQPLFATMTSEQGEPVGMALMFIEASHRKVLSTLTSILRTEASPIVTAGCDEAAADFTDAVEQYAKRRNVAVLSIGSFGGNASTSGLAQRGFRQSRFWEFVLDLSQPEDVLLSRMDAVRRQKIRKAQRMNVSVRELPGNLGIATLRKLQAASSQRIVARGGPDITAKNGRREDPIQVLLDAGAGRVIGAEVNGHVISAALFTQFNGMVYYTLSGHHEDALKPQAPTLLLWETIRQRKAEGARLFNFGGCSVDAINESHPEHGVYAYKRDFGGERIDCVTYDKVLFPIRHGVGKLLKNAVRIASKQ